MIEVHLPAKCSFEQRSSLCWDASPKALTSLGTKSLVLTCARQIHTSIAASHCSTEVRIQSKVMLRPSRRATMRIPGILQRIAWAYCIVALMVRLNCRVTCCASFLMTQWSDGTVYLLVLTPALTVSYVCAQDLYLPKFTVTEGFVWRDWKQFPKSGGKHRCNRKLLLSSTR
eukprot:SAG31_NODE_442_length_15661_cov_4.132245_10_plen_172_part_00